MKKIHISSFFCSIIASIGLLFPLMRIELSTNMPLVSEILRGKSLSLYFQDIGEYAWILPFIFGLTLVFNLFLFYKPISKSGWVLSLMAFLGITTLGVIVWMVHKQSQEEEFINRILAFAAKYFHLDMLGIYAKLSPAPATGFWVILGGLLGTLGCGAAEVWAEAEQPKNKTE